jgi:hypothetical protein
MSDPVQKWPTPWEPLTPGGVAKFARATLGRLWFVQLLVAAIAAVTVVWFLQQAWFPVVNRAIQQLPAEGEIQNRQLHLVAGPPIQLAENLFLGIAVDLNHTSQLGREPHLQIEFGRDDLQIIGLLGHVSIKYPPDWTVPFNRKELEPRWGAWKPAILCGAALATLVGLMLSWTVLATLYFVPVKLISFFENRDLRFRESWKLAGAALMPGALFLTFAIVGYGLHWLDLIRLGGLAGLHFLIGWIYLYISPLFLPRVAAVAAMKPNPFFEAKESGARPAAANPFSGPERVEAKPEQSGEKTAG